MTTPPSSLPSPTPSSSSSGHTQPFAMSHIQTPPNANPPVIARAASTSSHTSGLSGRESKMSARAYGDDVSSTGQIMEESYDSAPFSHNQQTPQPHPASHSLQPNSAPGPLPNANPGAYLPLVTSSPPPSVPTYIPPPQHAMAPDPIHGGGMMSGSGQGMMPPSTGMGGWQNGPMQPVPVSHWRPESSASSGSGYPIAQGGYRGSLANGHLPGSQSMPLDPQGHMQPTGYDGYPANRSTMSMSGGPGLPMGHPSYAQHAMMGMGGSGMRPGSAHGDGRDRRRDRERHRVDDGDGDRDSREDEVITTIFVVGFPDDMGEREFQNFFTFAPGFEAATLKFPSGSSRREPTAALLAELQQIAANQQAAAAAGEHIEQPLTQPAIEEALAALHMGGTASTSSSTTPSAAVSMTPSAMSNPMFGNSTLPHLPTRRQTIGFARFRTRADAIAAKEHLQGRKIDALTGATLKAEMAKKNLHTKRNTSGEELVGLLLRSGRLAGLMNAAQGQMQGAPGVQDPRAGGAGGMMPPPMPNSANPSGMTSPNQFNPSSAREAWDSWSSVVQQGGLDEKYQSPNNNNYPNSASGGGNVSGQQIGGSSSGSGQLPSQPVTGTSSQSNASSTSPPSSSKSPHDRPTDSKALLALAEQADEMEGWPLSGSSVGMGMNLDHHFNGNQNQNNVTVNHSSEDPIQGTQSSQNGTAPYTNTINNNLDLQQQQSSSLNNNNTSSDMRTLTSVPAMSYGRNYNFGGSPPGQGSQALQGGPGGQSDRQSESGYRNIGSNPADQNPPINTLYVGNLPAVSPPTHPPNFLEESLRHLFARAPGYKRMSYRQKINGPMVFVEFETIPYAEQAMKQLYGENLGGLIKGGIRLSYSKNSLGQRGANNDPKTSNPIFGGIAHTVALAGMSPPTNTNRLPNQNQAQNPQQAPRQGGTDPYGLGLHGIRSGYSNGEMSSGQGYQAQSPPVSMPGSSISIDARRGSEASGLSPNAQPFNASLSAATSPRNKLYSTSPSGHSSNNEFPTAYGTIPIPNGNASQAPSNGSGGAGGFSPVSSPIRNPAPFTNWVSSGGAASIGNGGYGFVSPPAPNISLSGAASAWSQPPTAGQAGSQ